MTTQPRPRCPPARRAGGTDQADVLHSAHVDLGVGSRDVAANHRDHLGEDVLIDRLDKRRATALTSPTMMLPLPAPRISWDSQSAATWSPPLDKVALPPPIARTRNPLPVVCTHWLPLPVTLAVPFAEVSMYKYEPRIVCPPLVFSMRAVLPAPVAWTSTPPLALLGTPRPPGPHPH